MVLVCPQCFALTTHRLDPKLAGDDLIVSGQFQCHDCKSVFSFEIKRLHKGSNKGLVSTGQRVYEDGRVEEFVTDRSKPELALAIDISTGPPPIVAKCFICDPPSLFESIKELQDHTRDTHRVWKG